MYGLSIRQKNVKKRNLPPDAVKGATVVSQYFKSFCDVPNYFETEGNLKIIDY